MTWQTKKLGEVCNIVNGSTPLRSRKEFWDNGDVAWFTIDDIREQGRVIKSTKQKIARAALGKTSVRLLPPESVLLCCTASVGDYAITKIPLTTNQQFNGLVVKDKKLLDPYFLFYYASTLKYQLLGLSGKTTIDFIPISRLSGIEIPIPPISEQKRIVKILDEVFEKMARAEENAGKNLQNAKELFESYLQSVFANSGRDWEERKLGELCEIITKGTTPTSVGFKFVEEGINFIKIESITTDGAFLPNKFAAITEECHKVLKRSQLERGDILFSIAGALGRTAFVNEKILPANTNQALAIVRLKSDKNVLPRFVLLCLNSGLTIGQIGKLKGGVAQQNLSLEQLRNFRISLPLIPEQISIVNKFHTLGEDIKTIENNYERKLTDLGELKKSILKMAFTNSL